MLIGLRVITGAALAWVYPPGMKVAAGWFEARRGAALGVLIGALTIGSAFPHLLASASTTMPWRTLMLPASALATIGGALVIAVVRDGPYLAGSALFDAPAVSRVFVERGTRLATLGYLGHMWELSDCTGFLLTMASIRLLPIAAQAMGWQWVFLCLAPGPLFGVLALRGLTEVRQGLTSTADG